MLIFDNPSRTYYAGQSVTGRVIIHLKKEIKIKGIFLHLEGKSAVRWTDLTGNRLTLSAKEHYFHDKYALQGTEGLSKLGPGEFIFPFSVNLPPNLPSSFESQYGYIRYTCSSIICQPWNFNIKRKAAITVLEVVDLNRIPGADLSASKEKEQKTGCCFCRSGSFSVAVSINKRGFVPGENIYIRADINNTSQEEIRYSSAKLLCMITYKARHNKKRETRTICDIGRGNIHPGSSDQWINQPLKIPPVPPTRLGTECKLINIEYFLQFAVVASGIFTTELDFTFPIIIGSIPLTTDFSTFAAHTRSLNTISFGGNVDPEVPAVELSPSSQPISPTAPPPYEATQLDEYPDLPPPSYEECVYGFVNIQDDEDDDPTSGELNFAPRYMYYNQVNYSPT